MLGGGCFMRAGWVSFFVDNGERFVAMGKV